MRMLSRAGRRMLVLAAVCGMGTPAWGEQFGVFNASLDQPRVSVMASLTPGGEAMVYDNATIDPNTLDIIVVQTKSFEAFLDTGASGYLISNQLYQGYTDPLSGDFSPGLRYQPPGSPAPAPQYPQLATYTGTGGTTQNVVFEDVGAVGTGGFYVSQQLHLSVANYPLTDPEDTTKYAVLSSNPVRVQVPVPAPVSTDPLEALLGQESFNIVGTPGMVGKVVVMDNRPLSQYVRDLNSGSGGSLLDQVYMKTYLYPKGTAYNAATLDTDPGVVRTKYTIKLTKVNLAGYTKTTPTVGPSPDLSYNPFIGPSPIPGVPDNGNGKVTVQFTFPGTTTTNIQTGSFLLDTGATASMISTSMATRLGLQIIEETTYDILGNPVLTPVIYTNEATPQKLARQFSFAIQGVGGQKTIAGFYLDRLVLPTEQGSATDPNDPNNIEFIDAPVLINDISVPYPGDSGLDFTVDGVLGMNFLTATMDYTGDIFNPGAMFEAPFDWVTFDEQAGILGLEPATVPEPAGLGILAMIGLVAGRRMRRLSRRDRA